MKNEDILDGNKLICEFMIESDSHLFTSPNYEKLGRHWISQKFQGIENPDGNDLLYSAEMKFHSSWDWLIPIIDKITSMDKYSKYIEYTSSMVYDGGIFLNTKFIENTFNDVVAYIKWYNLNYKL